MQALNPFSVALALAAPFIGSFLGVLVLRTADGGRSPGRAQSANPVTTCWARSISFRWRAGFRCAAGAAPAAKDCLSSIPSMEIGAVVPVLWAATLMSGPLLAASAGLGSTLIALGAIDWKTQRLPDALTLLLIVSGTRCRFCVRSRALAGARDRSCRRVRGACRSRARLSRSAPEGRARARRCQIAGRACGLDILGGHSDRAPDGCRSRAGVCCRDSPLRRAALMGAAAWPSVRFSRWQVGSWLYGPLSPPEDSAPSFPLPCRRHGAGGDARACYCQASTK